MPVPFLLLAILAPASQTPVPQSAPIIVTGHAWAPFISPMGEPFRSRSKSDDTLAKWFRQADRDHDGNLTAAEMLADADRFFATLDTNHDGQIDPDELAHYEYEIAPEIQVMSKTRRAAGQPAPAVDQSDPDDDQSRAWRHKRAREDSVMLGMGGALQGAARYALLNIPEPVAAADTNFNRLISREEFRQAAWARFQLLDSAHRGALTLTQLEPLRPLPPIDGDGRKLDPKALDTRIGNPLPAGP
jgi:Ca2+-binding EF-hand superfamily protein